MTKRMLIDATHAEETRVVVLDGSRLEDFDVETAAKKQLKGNIYLAKVVRVEPSLQAAFVEYGGGRHGFLAFGEIHPDYYQIPVADRQRLLELQEAEARAEEEAEDAAAAADEAAERAASPASEAPLVEAPLVEAPLMEAEDAADPPAAQADEPGHEPAMLAEPEAGPEPILAEAAATPDVLPPPTVEEPEHVLAEPADPPYGAQDEIEAALGAPAAGAPDSPDAAPEAGPPAGVPGENSETDTPPRTQAASIAQDVILGAPEDETLGADFAIEATEPAMPDDAFAQPQSPAELDIEPQEDEPGADEPRVERDARPPARFMRSYKIQEVIRRRQILLVQVVKEERGSKGAALTTYISLAGRFSVLMPNSPRGGGISRKITSTADRRRLKEVTSELQIPRGMGLIVRTAGANRPKAEIKRDCEYLLELWDSIRETTMKSVAPALIHEEANLIKRAIRDNYSRDVDEVQVDGETGWRAARDFMRMLMPAHARKVVLWNDPQPLFAKYQVEAQLDAMLTPVVQLRSGGYLVINQTEALVAIDVNSGRSTRERGIEETALKTNLEAADEVARQLRLRDLAGLIVIDFIDMESRRNNTAVEKRLKDALKDDRARIQLGAISSFGLMEMSRQRLRPSLAETSFTPCPHCGGTGHVRSTETSALAVLRAIEEEGAKRRAAEICVHVAGAIALYVLNHKRIRLMEIEARYGMAVAFAADETLLPPQTRIERLRAQLPGDLPEPLLAPPPIRTLTVDAEDEMAVEEDDETAEAEEPETEAEAVVSPAGSAAADAETRKRRRRRRGGRREDALAEPAAAPAPSAEAAPQPAIDPAEAEQPDLPLSPGKDPAAGLDDAASAAAEEARSRRRGRRGGRRRRRDEPGMEGAPAEAVADGVEAEAPASFDAPRPSYTGPTPADPFGGGVFDIYDVMEQAEERAASPPPPPVEAPKRPETEAEAAEATVPAEPAAPAGTEAAAEATAPAGDTTPDMLLEARPPIPQTVPLTHAADETLPAREPGPAEPAPVDTPRTTAPPEPVAQDNTPPEPGRAEPVTGPISAPVIIGAVDTPPAEKKRGWWRR